MTSSRLIKLFVVLFSIAAAGFVVWQLSRNLSGENAVGSADPNVDEKTEVMPIGPKSVGGALGVTEHFEPEPPKRPLLSGSKSPVSLPNEAVTIPGVPPAPSDDHSEGGRILSQSSLVDYVVMFEKAWFRILVVLFPLVAGGVFTWQSTRKLSGEVEGSGESSDANERPLMSGSKTCSEMLMEVDEAWELAVPPLEENSDPVEEK